MTDTTADAILKTSVTKGDYNDVTKNGPYHLMLPFGFGDSGLLPAGLPPELPSYYSLHRDFVLRQTPRLEGMWGNAVNIAMTQFASQGWDLKKVNVPNLRLDRARAIIIAANHRLGWVPFINKIVRDFLTQDNGAFVEVVRQSSARGSRIIGMEPLDSARCTRTGDPSQPVLYRDKQGREHILKDYQVLSWVDMPDPSDTWNGVGLCAASRAYRYIVKLAAIEQYVIEKVTGRRALALYIVSGISPATLDGVMQTAQAEGQSRGIQRYLGAILAGVAGDIPPSVVTIPFAELPDGFERKEEWDISLLAYADAIGIDIQELQPLTGQLAGTAGQSRTLDDKAKGKGLASLRQAMTHTLNEFVFSAGVTFAFTENNYGDQKAQAEIAKTQSDTLNGLIESGVITPAQALQVLVDLEVLPDTFLDVDETEDTSVNDGDGKDAVVDDIPIDGALPEQAPPMMPAAAQ